MLVIAAPGQGAQTPGFLSPWLELAGFGDRLSAWSELAGCDLIKCGTVATADEIRDTAVAQPLLVATALAVADVLGVGPALAGVSVGNHGPHGHVGGVVAGHSVGELAAGAIAGILRPDDALRLVRVRGQAMARAAAAEQTSMTAVLGADTEAILASIQAHGLTAANVNGAGQIVAAGTVQQLAAFAADPPPRARLRPLRVAGAFHTAHMASAVDALRAAAVGVRVSDPSVAVLSDRDGAVVRSGSDWLERIITQVSAPVRWDKCMQTMRSLGVTALIELPPAGTLTGLARRELHGVALLAIKTPDDLESARQLIADHADSHADSHAPDWRLLVAPLAGTFRAGFAPAGAAGPGAAVGSGAELGRVEIRGGSHLVITDFPATIIEWLVEDGDPVSPGQPLVRLQPGGHD
jgi:[acyl-carrier-protein] S-malonyltransferase